MTKDLCCAYNRNSMDNHFSVARFCNWQHILASKKLGIDMLVHQAQKLQDLNMQCEQSWQPYNANIRDCTDEIDFKVEQVCHELILSDIRVMNQAANLHLIARAELCVETEMQDSEVLWKEMQALFWDVLPIAI